MSERISPSVIIGHSVVIWRDGKVVTIPAEEIPVDISESDNPRPYPTPEE